MTGLFTVPGIGELSVGVTTRYGSKPHFHEGYSIGIFHGPATIWCRDALHLVGADDVVVLEPLEVHGGRGDAGDCPQDGMIIDAALVVDLFGCERPFRFASPVLADPALAQEWKAAMRSRSAAGLLSAIRNLFERHGVAAMTAPAGTQAPLEFDSCASIAECARSAELSRSHYSRAIRGRTGLSPRDYRRLRRVHAARSLIEAGIPLADCAAEAGFADQAHMTRQMRSILGVTPGSLRRSV